MFRHQIKITILQFGITMFFKVELVFYLNQYVTNLLFHLYKCVYYKCTFSYLLKKYWK